MTDEAKPTANVCAICNKPKKETSGSLTQWVFDEGSCNCGRQQFLRENDGSEDVKTEADFCFTCGKRKAMGRAGSLTQWIFRQDTCHCKLTELAEMMPAQSRLADQEEENPQPDDVGGDAAEPVAERAGNPVLRFSALLLAPLVVLSIVAYWFVMSQHAAEEKGKKDLTRFIDPIHRKVGGAEQSVATLGSMIDVAGDSFDRRYTKESSDVFSLSSGGLDLSGKNASDAFVKQLKIPNGYLQHVLLRKGDITDEGLKIIGCDSPIAQILLSQLPNITDDGFRALIKKNHLHGVYVGNSPLTAEVVPDLVNCPNLYAIQFRQVDLHGADFSKLAKLPYLRSLTLRYARLNDADLKSISRLRNLVVLDVTGSDISDQGLMQLAENSRLRALFVAACPRLTVDGLSRFSRSRPECKIEYSVPYQGGQDHERYLNNDDLKEQAAAGSKTITAAGWAITDEGMAHLVGRNIVELNVVHTDLSNKAFKTIAGLTSLQALAISGMPNISDAAIRELSRLKNLRRLSITGNKFSDHALAEFLEGVPGLNDLEAADSYVGTRSLNALAKSKNIRYLVLRNCNLHDDDIAIIARISGIRSLNLESNPQITKKALLQLQNCPKLTKLFLGPQATDDVVRALKERLRNCEIVVGSN